MSKVNLIPELRFPGFKNEGEWDIKEFGELINTLADYTANGSFASLKENVNYYTNEEYAVLVRTTDLDKKIFTPARFTDKKGYDFLSKTSLFGNEIVMANVGSIGKVFRVPYYEKPMTLAPNTYVLKFNKFIDEDFIYQLMLRLEFEKQLLSMVGSSTLMAINKSNLRSVKVAVPNPKEQQKIASCLSSLDEVISAHNKKLDALKDHKKGLMQNLFPQEGETVPKYRFKEFEKDGEWVEKTLIDTADKKVKWSFTGGPFGSNLMASDYTSTGFRIIQLQNIGDGVFNDDNKIYASLEKADELLSCNIYAGDIIISKMGDPVGRACIIPENLQRCIMASDGIRLVVDETKYSKYFIYSLINSKRIREAIEKRATGSTRKRIGLDTLREIKLNIPKSPKEQQKIASCLSSLDELIMAEAEKIEQLKLHKKGLMQGLFPKIND